jgi:TolB-like protein/Flp pilus assembly protein TadD
VSEGKPGLFEELKRRNVIRVALLYGVTAWMVFEVASGLLPIFEVPDWVLRAVVLVLLLGFIPTLVFSWAYEVTPEGIKRESEVDRSSSTSRVTGRQIDRLTVSLLVVLIAIVAVDRFTGDTESGPGVSVPEPTVEANSEPQADDPATLSRTTIAVLPFVSRSTEADTSIFADGIHDDLLTMLANIGSLKVISRTSVMEYRDTTKNMRAIGSELGAGTLLEGGVQQAGDNVRINVQLISAETDEHLWARTYDRALSTTNIFAIQSEIAESIASQLAATLSPDELNRIRRNPTDSLEAYNAYVRGRQVRTKQTFDALRQAEQAFRDAIELDPDYVDAQIDLARTVAQLAHTGAVTSEEMTRTGRQHIDRAIELDPGNGYAWAVLGAYQSLTGDTAGAESSFSRAESLSPRSPAMLETVAEVLRRRGDDARALPIIQRALELDPLSLGLRHDLGYVLVGLGELDAADAAFSHVLEVEPGNPRAPHGKSAISAALGRPVEAAYWSDRAWAIDPPDFENPTSSAILYFDAGYADVARERIEKANAMGPGESYPMAIKSYYLALVGDSKQALATAREALVSQLDDRWGSHLMLLRVVRDSALRGGNDYGEALGWYRQLTPGLFDDQPEITPVNIQKATDLGQLLIAAGEVARGRSLLEAVIAGYDRHYVRGSANMYLGVAKASSLAVLDRHDEALAELRRAYDDGWRIMWRWELEANPSFAAIRDRPAFQTLIKDFEADILVQQRSFEAAYGGPPAEVSQAPDIP